MFIKNIKLWFFFNWLVTSRVAQISEFDNFAKNYTVQSSRNLFFNSPKTTTVTVAVQHWHLARPQLQANTAWNESLHNSLHKRVSLALPCWKLARTIICRPYCTASVICCMLSILFLVAFDRSVYCSRKQELFLAKLDTALSGLAMGKTGNRQKTLVFVGPITCGKFFQSCRGQFFQLLVFPFSLLAKRDIEITWFFFTHF